MNRLMPKSHGGAFPLRLFRLAALAIVVVLAACSGPGTNSHSIVGSWTREGALPKALVIGEQYITKAVLTSDGKMSLTIAAAPINNGFMSAEAFKRLQQPKTHTATYVDQGDGKLQINVNGEAVPYTYVLKGNTLTLTPPGMTGSVLDRVSQ